MAVEVGLLLPLWTDVVNTSCYTQNRSIIVKLLGKTSYEMLKGRKPNISYYHVFGCVSYILSQKYQCSKFEETTDEGFFLGYSNRSKAYKVLNINYQIIEESIHIMFDDKYYTNDPINHSASVIY